MTVKKNLLPSVIENAMYGFMLSYILFTGDELSIFDFLSSGNSYSLNEIAKATKTNAMALERLLLSAVAAGLLLKLDHKYQMPEEFIPYLAYNGNRYCGACFSYFRNSTINTFQCLREVIQHGRLQYNHFLQKTNSSNIFKKIYSDTNKMESFLSSMWGLGFIPANELIKQYSLSKYNNLIDLGGASGSFAIAALTANPRLTGIVYDFPEVEPYFTEKCKQFALTERLKFMAGDFFHEDIPTAEIYVLGYVLSDWSTADGTALLTKIYNKLPTDGIIIILEKLFDKNKTGPFQTSMMNLAMLLETEGQHRSLEEYYEWLISIGFSDCQHFFSSGEKHMIIGKKL
jgi:hypothetical protein